MKNRVSRLIKDFEGIKKRIARERDKLREAIGEMEEIADDCDASLTSLQEAVDALSKYL